MLHRMIGGTAFQIKAFMNWSIWGLAISINAANSVPRTLSSASLLALGRCSTFVIRHLNFPWFALPKVSSGKIQLSGDRTRVFPPTCPPKN